MTVIIFRGHGAGNHACGQRALMAPASWGRAKVRTHSALPTRRAAADSRRSSVPEDSKQRCQGQIATSRSSPVSKPPRTRAASDHIPSSASASAKAANTAEAVHGEGTNQAGATDFSHAAAPVALSRRTAGGLLLATGAAVMGVHGGPRRSGSQAWARPPPPLPLPPCSGPLDGQLAAALTRAVYSTVVQLQVMDEAAFQRENFKLREREYRYYAEANRQQLPRIPDLIDNTGGLSNPFYFNFINYCLWKVVYRHVTAPADREVFAKAAAADFLSRVWPSGVQQQLAGADTTALPALAAAPADAVVRSAVLPFLELLLASGYICRYQVVLGSHPGSWPQDWMLSQPVLLEAYMDAEVAGPQQADPSAPGLPVVGPLAAPAEEDFLFQVKLHRPADILGSVALRSEEGSSWPGTVSSCLLLLLGRQGYSAAGEDAPEAVVQGQTRDASGLLERAAGSAECDEFFYQDAWQGPTSLADRVLLFFGDPLEKVGVDFVPTTLVQNWRLRGPARGG